MLTHDGAVLPLTSFFAGLVLSLAGFPADFRVGPLLAKRIAGFTGILAMRRRLLGASLGRGKREQKDNAAEHDTHTFIVIGAP
jgi:hypothetical protein